MTVIDGATGAVTATVTGTGGYDPTGIAVNPVTDTVYAAYRGLDPQVAVIDGATDTITTVLVNGIPDVSAVDPVGIAVNPVTDTFYTANYGESVSEYNGTTNALISTANVGGLPLECRGQPRPGHALPASLHRREQRLAGRRRRHGRDRHPPAVVLQPACRGS